VAATAACDPLRPSRKSTLCDAAMRYYEGWNVARRGCSFTLRMSLFSLLLLLAPLLASIIMMRPFSPEFLLLALPLVAAIIAAFFAFHGASYLLLESSDFLWGSVLSTLMPKSVGSLVSPLLRAYSIQRFRAWKTA